MSDPASPKAWANFLVRAWGPNFPVNVRTIALDYSKRFDDPIVSVAPADVDHFEGAIYFRPITSKKPDRWFILYNSTIASNGRRNFTLAHEFGHYLNHRSLIRRSDACALECTQSAVLGIDTDAARTIEREADQFASYLLMPMDDFRRQTAGQSMCLDLMTHCADRYEVSLTAATMKWLEFTDERAVLVVGIDGFVLWSWSSPAAFASYIYFKKGTPLPELSVAIKGRDTDGAAGSGVEPVREITTFADRYELTISLLILYRTPKPIAFDDEELTPHVFDVVSRN